MSIFNKLPMAAVIVGVTSTFLVNDNVLAGNGGGCPVFNSSMVDAAWLAVEYSQPEPPVGGAIDDPSVPTIGCQLTNDIGNQFTVFVGGGNASVAGNAENSPVPTLLRTAVGNLTKAEQHACRAQVLSSFVWNQYCKPALVE